MRLLLKSKTGLTAIDLCNCQITSLPLDILPQLTHLKQINLSRNKLTSLPEELHELWMVHEIDVTFNPIDQETGWYNAQDQIQKVLTKSFFDRPAKVRQMTNIKYNWEALRGLLSK